MNKTILMGAVLSLALCGALQAAEYVTQGASGSTVAAVTFDGRPTQALRVVSVDATSDKAASVLTWRVGSGNYANILLAAANTVTNITTTANTFADNDVVLLKNAAGTVTERTIYGISSNAYQYVTFQNVLGTNLAVGDPIYEITNNTTTIYAAAALDTNATELHVTSTNTFAPDDKILVRKATEGWTAILTVADVSATNLTVSAPGAPWTLAGGDHVTRLTSQSTVQKPALKTDFTVIASGTNYLTVGDQLIIAPASGGIFTNYYRWTEGPIQFYTISVTAATGLALAEGDGVYGSSTLTTPVGAATLRRDNPVGVFTAPPGRPVRLSLDGTSAVKLNAVVGVYE